MGNMGTTESEIVIQPRLHLILITVGWFFTLYGLVGFGLIIFSVADTFDVWGFIAGTGIFASVFGIRMVSGTERVRVSSDPWHIDVLTGLWFLPGRTKTISNKEAETVFVRRSETQQEGDVGPEFVIRYRVNVKRLGQDWELIRYGGSGPVPRRRISWGNPDHGATPN